MEDEDPYARHQLAGAGRGGQMAGPTGSESRLDRAGSSSVPLKRRALVTHTHKGPSPIYRVVGPFPARAHRTPRAGAGTALVRTAFPQSAPDLCTSAPALWTTRRSLWSKVGFGRILEMSCRKPCDTWRQGHRTLPTHSLRGEWDSSETRVHTTLASLLENVAAIGCRDRWGRS